MVVNDHGIAVIVESARSGRGQTLKQAVDVGGAGKLRTGLAVNGEGAVYHLDIMIRSNGAIRIWGDAVAAGVALGHSIKGLIRGRHS